MEVMEGDSRCIPFSTRKKHGQDNYALVNRQPSSSLVQQDPEVEEEEDEDMLPGFRFHPTDEELVGFYLRRKVEGKSLRIELIKQVDIYKYEPWELPKASGSVGDKEWYFFCVRGRKYRNSIRPNRVTGSGFWKATGIDRPIHSNSDCRTSTGSHCIGLKKSLVYYRGSAGKGTKTDWMMHEFRLPTKSAAGATTQEVETWTLCRIFKRNVSQRKYLQILCDSTSSATDVQEGQCSRLQPPLSESSSKSSSTVESSIDSRGHKSKTKNRHFDDTVVPAQATPYNLYMTMYDSQQLPQTLAPNLGIDTFRDVNWDELMGFTTDQGLVYDTTT